MRNRPTLLSSSSSLPERDSLSLFNLRVADDSRVYGDKGVYQDLLQGVADHGCKIGEVR